MANYVSAHCVGDYFLLQTDQNAGDTISNLKLQKLCYYAQAWHYTLKNNPLFNEKIKAWAHGPVIPDLYHRFKQYRWDAIDPSDLITNPYEDLHGDDMMFLDSVWNRYSPLSAKQLERLTHSEDPWKEAYGDRPTGQACDAEITLDSMKAYFGRKLHAA
jgi:uncharacterized phage-associated protein